MKTRRFKSSLAIGLTGLAFAVVSANAAHVLIDFSTAAVAPSPDTNGNHWNSFGNTSPQGSGASITVSNLLLSDNSGNSPWSVSVGHSGESPGNRSGFGGTAINGPIGATSPFNTTGADRPTVDGIFAGPQTVPITFSNLAANTNYFFELIGGRSGGNANPGLIALTAGTAVSGLTDNEANLLNNGTILSFGATSTAGGVITFAFSVPGAVGMQADTTLNAMSIIPEPSAALLGVLGMLGLLRRRR